MSLDEFSPEETPEYLQAVSYAHHTREVASELLCSLLDAQTALTHQKRALRKATGLLAAAERASLRQQITASTTRIAELTEQHTKADAIATEAWEARTALYNAQRAQWEAEHPDAANAAFRRQLDWANRERQDRRTRKAQLVRRALSA